MSNSPNKGIPYVPEGTLDPAAGLNESINVLDAIDSVVGVISMSLSTPPATNSDGDLYIVAEGSPSWPGVAPGRLARYVQDGDFWISFEPGSQVTVVYNREDGYLYRFDEVNSPTGWVIAAGIFDAPSDGLRYARRDAGWESFQFPIRAERVSWLSTTEDPLTSSVNRVDLVVPYAGTIVGAFVTSIGGPGNAIIDIWKDTYANWPPDNSDSILASSPIQLSAAEKYHQADPEGAGWQTDVAANDILRFDLTSVSAFTGLFVTLLIRPL